MGRGLCTLTLEWEPSSCPSPAPVGPGGGWSTLASDIFDCCYFTSKLSRGGVYTFRTACVSKAGMGPYSSPSEQVLLGGPSHLGERSAGPGGQGAGGPSGIHLAQNGWGFVLPASTLAPRGSRNEVGVSQRGPLSGCLGMGVEDKVGGIGAVRVPPRHPKLALPQPPRRRAAPHGQPSPSPAHRLSPSRHGFRGA